MLAVTSDVKFYAGPRLLSCHKESGKHNLFCVFFTLLKQITKHVLHSKGEILRNANVLEHYSFKCFKL